LPFRLALNSRRTGADTPEGRLARERFRFLAVPFMDKDGVEDGDQGKNRRPRDHNECAYQVGGADARQWSG
jgi:murein tripeptide amidase MpaA